MKRKKFIRNISFATAAVLIPGSSYSISRSEKYEPLRESYTGNPLLSYIPGVENYPGTPLDQKGLFMNEKHVFWPRMGDVLKWKLSSNPYRDEKENYNLRLNVIKRSSLDEVPDDSITWLGHASYLLQLNGQRILIDPVLTPPGLFLKRYSELPFELNDFKGVDYILISHNHRDHCDKSSVELLAKQNPNATWLCGLELDNLVLKDWTGSQKIQAAGWYQHFRIPTSGLQISFLPTRHWSRRGLFDTNKSLWGAFMIESGGKKIYFGGDTGYSEHFKRTNELFGEVDYYLAGVGAFAPRWFMNSSHMHPEEAAKASNELQAKNLLPMHFGTFDLSDEPLLEPGMLMRQLKAENAFDANLIIPAVGEVVSIGNN
ncbi:MBL fold metallo-hydrolase [Salinimicrobium sp. CDJ15-81-2]|nr:MBL fold metallo-hydrolase [Salinimicrobium nanhaiense]